MLTLGDVLIHIGVVLFAIGMLGLLSMIIVTELERRIKRAILEALRQAGVIGKGPR